MYDSDTKLSSANLRKEIYQSNPLINARKGMNLIELKLFALALRSVNPHISSNDKYFDKEFNMTYISPSDVVKIFGNPKYLTELKTICKRLFNATIEISDDSGNFKLLHIFKTIEYKSKKGLFIQFDDDMKPYVLDFINGKGYTRIEFSELFTLRSSYAWRLYELLMQYRGMKGDLKRKLTVEQLRFALDVPTDAYVGRMNNFKRKVVEEAVAEINFKTSCQVYFKVIKSGRQISAFEFYYEIIEQRDNSAIVKTDSEFQNVRTRLQALGFSSVAIKRLISISGSHNECQRRLNYAEEVVRKYEIRGNDYNKLALIYSAISQCWVDDTNLPNILERHYPDDDVVFDASPIPIKDEVAVRSIIDEISRGVEFSLTTERILKDHRLNVKSFIKLYMTSEEI